MDQRVINLFDEYTHKPLPRQEFIRRLVMLTGSMSAAMTVLPILELNYANAATIPENDDDLISEDVTYQGEDTMKAYLSRPKLAAKYGSVVVIHENRGLNPHIRDITRRMAKAGYLALAPDALSPFGGTPANEDEARGLFSKLDAARTRNNFLKAFDYLKARPESNQKTGCIGFCWGGAMANQMAVHSPSLNAAVSFYGSQPDPADASTIKAALQLHYAGLDERINAGIEAYEAALKKAGVNYKLFIYEGAQHAFHNDTSTPRYNEAAAKLAWERSLRLFKEKLT